MTFRIAAIQMILGDLKVIHPLQAFPNGIFRTAVGRFQPTLSSATSLTAEPHDMQPSNASAYRPILS